MTTFFGALGHFLQWPFKEIELCGQHQGLFPPADGKLRLRAGQWQSQGEDCAFSSLPAASSFDEHTLSIDHDPGQLQPFRKTNRSSMSKFYKLLLPQTTPKFPHHILGV